MASLLKTRRFLPLFLTQFGGAFNDNLLKNAIVILVTYRSIIVFGIPPDQMVAIAGGIFILPFFLFSAIAGKLADRLDKARMIFWVKVSEIGIMLLAATGFLIPQFPVLLAALFLMGIHSAFFGPLKYSILPQHLSASELISGNAWVEAGTFLAILLGTLAGGVLISLDHGDRWVCAALTAVSVFGLAACRYIPPAPPATSSPQSPLTEMRTRLGWNPLAPTWEILQMIFRNVFLLRIIVAISWFWFFGAVVLSLIPLIGKNNFRAEQGIVTLFLALFSIGIGIGSMACGRLSHHQARIRISFWGLGGMSLFSMLLYWMLPGALPETWPPSTGPETVGIPLQSLSQFLSLGYSWAVLAGLLGIAISGGLFIVPLYTLMQERSDPSARSQVIAANNIVNALFMVVAAVLLALLLKANYSAAQIFFYLAIANVVSGVAIFRLSKHGPVR